MFINLKHKEDTITIDLRCNSIRIVKEDGSILFRSIPQTTKECYEYLWKNSLTKMFKALKEELYYIKYKVIVNELGIL